jgi:hypothetical protein
MATSKTSPTAGETRSTDGAPSGEVVPVVEAATATPDAAAEVVEDAPRMADLSGIRYVGMANVRKITAMDLEKLGVENPKGDLEWNDSNNRVVRTEEFNAATRDALLALKDFVVA